MFMYIPPSNFTRKNLARIFGRRFSRNSYKNFVIPLWHAAKYFCKYFFVKTRRMGFMLFNPYIWGQRPFDLASVEAVYLPAFFMDCYMIKYIPSM
jgi:hypothetical protein